jgi:hypothetical protein
MQADRNAPCPFPHKLCKSTYGNLFLDTGYLNSNEYFGINTPPEERFYFRNPLHCAPLAT